MNTKKAVRRTGLALGVAGLLFLGYNEGANKQRNVFSGNNDIQQNGKTLAAQVDYKENVPEWYRINRKNVMVVRTTDYDGKPITYTFIDSIGEEGLSLEKSTSRLETVIKEKEGERKVFNARQAGKGKNQDFKEAVNEVETESEFNFANQVYDSLREQIKVKLYERFLGR